MAARRTSENKPSARLGRPATTPEARENQLISLAYDLAEQQLRDGTASSQVITSFLKLGSSRDRLEKERIQMEVELMEAKREAMASAERTEQLMEDAINAFRSYSPTPLNDFGGGDEDEDVY